MSEPVYNRREEEGSEWGEQREEEKGKCGGHMTRVMNNIRSSN